MQLEQQLDHNLYDSSNLLATLLNTLKSLRPGKYVVKSQDQLYYIIRTLKIINNALRFGDLSFGRLSAAVLMIVTVLTSCSNNEEVINSQNNISLPDLQFISVTREYVNLNCEPRDIGISVTVSASNHKESIGFDVSINEYNAGMGIKSSDFDGRVWLDQKVFYKPESNEITIIIDSKNQITESNEENNTKVLTIAEYEAFPLLNQNPTCDPPKVQES